ncbi:MAG: hypothetical protein KDD43_13875, partial [Bdellovibrionales bacterium]|nr:hypothetical protein [Bdellovibrionales bacterium]
MSCVESYLLGFWYRVKTVSKSIVHVGGYGIESQLQKFHSLLVLAPIIRLETVIEQMNSPNRSVTGKL